MRYRAPACKEALIQKDNHEKSCRLHAHVATVISDRACFQTILKRTNFFPTKAAAEKLRELWL